LTTTDLHPEEMLDAARRGTLGATGQADLRAHLHRCVACRLSLSWPDDLRAEAAATTADGVLLARMMRVALLDEPRAASDPRAYRARGGVSLRRAALGLVLLLVGGSAGAAIWAGRESFSGRLGPVIVQFPEDRGRVDPETSPRRGARAHRPAAPEVAEAEPASPTNPLIVEPPSTLARPAAVAAPAATRRARAETPRPSADALFADANRARRMSDYGLALRRYADLRRAYPGTREEITARVVVGQLMLAQGSSREALARFDSYLAASPEGTLAEEARVGRALALMRLGRRDEEREAWGQLLRNHPGSVQGVRARSRLGELR
jgi:TolA-binding protein